MSTIAIPVAAGGGTLTFSWEQPAESKQDESLGDGQKAIVSLKMKGDAATRFQAGAAFLEWAVDEQSFGTNIPYLARNNPWPYQGLAPLAGSALADSLDTNQGSLFASRFLNGKGVGPIGQASPPDSDGGAGTGTPIPEYQYYFSSLECTTRPYAILPDSSVLAPGPIGGGLGPALVAAVVVAPPTNYGKDFPPGSYVYAVTALTTDGETLPIEVGPVLVAVQSYGVRLTLTPVPGALGYKVYRGGATPGSENVWVAVPLGADTTTFIDTFRWPNVPATPPAADSTASPLFNGGGAGRLPDEGAALAAATGETGERYIVRDDEDGSRFVQVPKGLMRFTDSAFQTQVGLTRIVPFTSIEYTWMGVPVTAIPKKTIRTLQGCVSTTTFDGWPPWTLLFKSAKPTRYRSVMGVRVADVKYRFDAYMNQNLLGYFFGFQAALEFTPSGAGPNGYRTGLVGLVDWSIVNADLHGAGSFIYPFCQGFGPLFRPQQS